MSNAELVAVGDCGCGGQCRGGSCERKSYAEQVDIGRDVSVVAEAKLVAVIGGACVVIDAKLVVEERVVRVVAEAKLVIVRG